MIDKYELRVGNTVFMLISRNIPVIGTIQKGDDIDHHEYLPIEITKETLKHNLGFEVTDMGDFWQCEKEDFVLIQPKIQVIQMETPFIFVLKSSIEGSVVFKYVHHLQNTYLDLKGQKLTWIK